MSIICTQPPSLIIKNTGKKGRETDPLGISSSTSCSPVGGGDGGALAGRAAGGGVGAHAELPAFRLNTAVRRGRALADRVEEGGVGAAAGSVGPGGVVNPRRRGEFLGVGAAEGAGVPFPAVGGGADMAAGSSRVAGGGFGPKEEDEEVP